MFVNCTLWVLPLTFLSDKKPGFFFSTVTSLLLLRSKRDSSFMKSNLGLIETNNSPFNPFIASGQCFNCILTKPCWKKQKHYCSFCNITHHCIFCWRVPISCEVILSHDSLERFPRKGKSAKCCWNYKFPFFLCWQNSPENSVSKEFGTDSHKSLLAYAEGLLNFHISLSALLSLQRTFSC